MSILIQITIMFAMLLTAKYIFNSTQKVNDGNLPVSLTYSGFILALFLALSGTLEFSVSNHDIDIYLFQVINAISTLILLFLSLQLSNKLFFTLPNVKETLLSVGLFDFFFLLSTGIVMFSSSYGDGDLLSMFVFFILGQLSIISIIYFHNLIYRDLLSKIEQGSISNALFLGSSILSFSIIISASIFGDSINILLDIKEFFIYSLYGFLTLGIFANRFIDKVFLPSLTINDAFRTNNYAAIMLLSSFKVGFAIIIALNI